LTANAFEANWADGGVSNDADALIAAINQIIAGGKTQEPQRCEDG